VFSVVELVALRRVAPRSAARRFHDPAASPRSFRPLNAGGFVAARRNPPLNTYDRPGNGWPLAILLAHSFLKGAARVLLETPANSLFLSRFSIDKLPLIYVATAIVCTAIGLVYARLESGALLRCLGALLFW
jgi:hypothetical protein